MKFIFIAGIVFDIMFLMLMSSCVYLARRDQLPMEEEELNKITNIGFGFIILIIIQTFAIVFFFR